MLVRTRRTDVVHEAFELFEKGDVDALATLYHPYIEVTVAGTLDGSPATYRGRETARAYLKGLVAEGLNCGVEGLELIELGGRVAAAGRMKAPANVPMRWNFHFDGDLISRVEPLPEVAWATLGERDFHLGRIVAPPHGGTVELQLGDGRELSAPIVPQLVEHATPHVAVLVYFDGGELAGWYLPDVQLGMVVR